MIIIRNKFIPFKGYIAINIFGILFCRKNAEIDYITLNHERIHTAQMKEMLFIFFYLWYGIEYLIRLIIAENHHIAYRNISFEKEAYAHEENMAYLIYREHFNWIKY